MNKSDLIQKIFESGKNAGMTDMEAHISSGRNLSLKVFNKEIDKYSVSESEGLSFRGLYKGKMGYSYTEKVDETSIDIIIKEAVENAEIIDSDDEEYIFEGSNKYEEVNNYYPALEKVNETQKIEFTKKLEEEALKLDSRVAAVQECAYGDGYGETIMKNTKGLELQDKNNVAFAYIYVLVREGEDSKSGFSYKVTNDFESFNAAEMAEEAVNEALSLLGAKSIKSGEYKVILRNNTAADLLESFAGIFSAEKVQKDLSLLKGKINEEIACNKLTIIDDPFMKEGMASNSFDGEGVACKYKRIIDKGILKTYLHNLKTAKKDGVESTGNASKSSYKASVGVFPTNMYIEKGDKTLDEMISTIDKGILIVDLQGLHAGLNSVSGDFSLAASGYEIENGKIKRPINQITVAGNFFEVIKNIEEIGNDLKFGLPSNAYIGSPSLKIKSLSIAGE